MRPLIVALLLAAPAACAQLCEAPPKVQAAIDAALSASSGKPLDERIAVARKTRDQFPNDYYAHRFYQEQFIGPQRLFAKSVQDEYKSLSDAHPSDLMYQMLYARTLKGTDTPKAITLLDAILARDPDHPLAHLKLVEIYSAQAFRDNDKLKAHAAAYTQGCPASLDIYQHIVRVPDLDFIKSSAQRLRKLLENRTDDRALGLYYTLWEMEFKAVPLSRQDPVRERIRQDVARLRAMNASEHPIVLTELDHAYKMLGDAEGSKWVEEHRPAQNGSGGQAGPAAAISKWRQANPRKGDYAEQQEKVATQAREWVRQWPDDPVPRRELFDALQYQADAALEEVAEAADEWLRVYERHPAPPSPYMEIAEFFSRKNMRYGQLPDLLEKALKELESQPATPVSDLYVTRDTQHFRREWHLWNEAARTYIKIKHYDRARELLAKLNESLEASKPADTAPEQEKRQYNNVRYQYWDSMARLARGQGHKPDALVYQAKAIAAFDSPDSQERQMTSLRTAWKDLGGTDEGFDLWVSASGTLPKTAPPPARYAVAAGQTSWTKLDKRLPDFQISDADGKNWSLENLKGKVTLITLWATWCGPCQAELPYLQTLFNKVRGRQDLAILTLNTDENLGLIEPFLRDNKYSFPVLPARDYVDKVVPQLAIPRTWIVDADGVLRLERVGFGSGSDKWVDDMIAEMEKARK